MKTIVACLALIAQSLAAAPAGAESLRIVLPTGQKAFTVRELQSKLKMLTVRIDDPVYKRKMSFDGFALHEVLRLAGAGASASGDELVFTASDGYSPNTSFAALQSHRAYLVFREHGKKGFDKIEQGKTKLSPAPFYVVWEEGKALAEQVPWPYQLVKIEVVDFAKKYARMYPEGVTDDSAVKRGFLLFKNQCMRCHSINLQGGELGPELNAPMNVTEYWPKETLRRFIRDSSSFRYKDKMPPFTHLKEEDIENILHYLEHMRSRKIKP